MNEFYEIYHVVNDIFHLTPYHSLATVFSVALAILNCRLKAQSLTIQPLEPSKKPNTTASIVVYFLIKVHSQQNGNFLHSLSST